MTARNTLSSSSGTRLFGLVIVAGAAFTLGRLSPFAGVESEASATPAPLVQDDLLDPAAAAGTPGEHHEVLGSMIGKWDARFKLWAEPDGEPMSATGSVEREWVLDGRYVKETVVAQTPAGEFRGIGYIGYNNLDGQYELVWMDNTVTAISVESGLLDRDTMVMTTWGNHRDPITGHVIHSMGTLNMSNGRQHVYEGKTVGPDGKMFKTFEGLLNKSE